MEMKQLIQIGYPVIGHSIAMVLINQTDKLLLAALGSEALVGEYGVIAQFASTVNIFGATVAMAYVPIFYKYIMSNEKNKQNELNRIKMLSIIAYSIFGLFIYILITTQSTLIFGETFQFRVIPFALLIIGNVCFATYHLYSGYFYLFKKTKLLALITSTIALTNLLISYLLIPRYGLSGAAFGTLMSFILGCGCAIIFGWYSNRYLKPSAI